MEETYIIKTDRILTGNDIEKVNAALLSALSRSIPLVGFRLARVEYLASQEVTPSRAWQTLRKAKDETKRVSKIIK